MKFSVLVVTIFVAISSNGAWARGLDGDESYLTCDSCKDEFGGRDLDQEEKNKELVIKFYEQVFGDRNLDGIEKYLDPDYIQHNPLVPDGREPVLEYLNSIFPKGVQAGTRFKIERAIAEGDWVWLHLLSNELPDSDPAGDSAVVDIFRVQNGVIVEHFDVIQPVTKWSSNPHPYLNYLAKEFKEECAFARP